eukprot:TRINITY_DN13625_c0_g1_i1.p1 TRINITY_DN13625_c0_g1~~TRINITY_DN13625_c0_g1_i1.p1  ORF type:complete len:243 (-),score=55.43 TRINITY_DN13625_c0_g1_i1:176-904(-)
MGRLSSCGVHPSFFEFELLACELQVVDVNELQSHPHEYSLLFWCNAYNLLALYARIAACPPEAPSSRERYFTLLKLSIGGYLFSLDDIMHGILRANRSRTPGEESRFLPTDRRMLYSFSEVDPRIHFLLHYHARSCPPLRPLFDDADVEACSEAFCSAHVKLLSQTKISLPRIMQRYARDFGSTPAEMGRCVSRFSSNRDRLMEVVLDDDTVYEYEPFDWSASSLKELGKMPSTTPPGEGPQ